VKKSRRFKKKIYSLLSVILLSILGVIIPGIAHPNDTVIVNISVSQIELSKSTLQAIFGMRLRKWPNGTPIKVFILSDEHTSHIGFCKLILNVFPHQLRRAWNRLVYSGTGQVPIEVASMEQMLARIATTSGAIGYIDRSLLNDQVRSIPIK